MHVEVFEYKWNWHFLPERSERIITASRDRGKLAQFLNSWHDTPSFKIITNQMQKVSIVTDNKPFFYIYDLQMIKPFLLVIFGLCMLTLLVILETKRRKSIAYFFLIGIGFMLTEYVVCSMFQSFFSDPVSTIAVITGILLTSAALGSFYSDKLNIQSSRLKYLMVFILTLAWLLFCIQNLPFSIRNWFLKSSIALIAIAPFAFIMGIFFPLGLKKLSGREVPLAYFFDAVGTSAGLFLFYVLSIKFGYLINFYFLTTVYILSIFLYRIE